MSSLRPIYCPVCFNHTLFLKEKGKVTIYFDGKQRTSGQFIFNLEDQRPDQLKQVLEEKLEEYFKWYGEFQNKAPIKKIDLFSSDFFCENGCEIPSSTKLSVIGVLFSEKYVMDLISDLASDNEILLDL